MGTRDRLAQHLPVFALEVRTPRIVLRYPDDEDALDLAELGAAGIHAPDRMPFSIPWSTVPAPHQQRNSLAFFWSQRGTIQQEEWHMPLAVVLDGRVIGTQGLMGRSWSVLRAFETGSWLGREWQGQGLGKEMRAAALHLGFAGFDALEARTAAFADNPSSLGVTRSLGYRESAVDRVVRDGTEASMHRFTMSRTDWEAIRRDDIEVVGAAEVAAMFGTEVAPGSSGSAES